MTMPKWRVAERLIFGRPAIAVHAIAAFALMSIVAAAWSGQYFRGGDGSYYKLLNSVAIEYISDPLRYSGPDPLQGMGGVVAPFNPWLSPPFLANYFFSDPHFKACVPFVLLAFGMFLSIYGLGRATLFSRPVSLIAAWLGALLAAPLTTWSSLFGLYAIPTLQIAIAGNLALACFALLGRSRSPARNLIAGLAMMAFAVWPVLFSPADATVGGVSFALLIAGYMAGIRQRKEFVWKVGAMTAAGLFFLTTGLFHYLLALPAFTARIVSPVELVTKISAHRLMSLASVSPLSVLAAIAFVAAAVCLFRRSQRFLSPAAALVLSMTACGAASIWYVMAGGSRLPAPYQFEFYLIGFYALFGVKALYPLAVTGLQKLGASASVPLGHGAARLSIIVVLGTLLMVDLRSPLYGIIARPLPATWTTARTPISEYLESHLAIRPGSPWRGSVVSYIGRDARDAARRPDKPYEDIRPHFGNNHSDYDLRISGIPTLEYNSPFIPPPIFQFTSTLLMRPGTPRGTNVLYTTRLRPRILRALGVRHVVDDIKHGVPGVVIVKKLSSTDGQKTLYLHDLGIPNVGDYSPTEVVVRPTAETALRTLDDHAFDFRRSAVVSSPIPENLVPVSESRLTVTSKGYRVTASSKGLSLILLPLQYSRCLEWRPSSPDQAAAPRLLQTNLIQTGVLFSGQIDGHIAYKFGPLSDVSCRFQDLADYQQAMPATPN